MQQVEKRLFPGKLSTFFPMEMVPGLSEQPFQRWLQVQKLATIATICNKVENCFFWASRAHSFQWKWSQGCVKNRFYADCSCNILQRVFFFWIEFLSLLSRFSMLESACYVLSRIYWWLQQVQRLAIICNKAKITVFLVVEPALSNGADLRCVQELLKQFPLQRYTN